MQSDQVFELGRQALITTLMIGGPVLLTGLLVGLVIGLFQALTQIQEQTIALVPKIIAMLVVVGLCLPWFISKMLEYSNDLIVTIPDRF
ncbi:MAG: flagellar biosynthesis protein FliQ [Planctomycetia bacterium]|jgi:flagellar biosynthetic protein FliQ